MAFVMSSYFIGFTVAVDTPHWALKSSGRPFRLTHWGRVTHICVSYLTIIASDNGLSPSRRQAIIWTNAGILLIRRLGTNFSAILIEIHTFSFKKMHLKMSSAKRRPFSLGLNVLKKHTVTDNKSIAFVGSSCSIWHILEKKCSRSAQKF